MQCNLAPSLLRAYSCSLPTDFNKRGYNILNVNRIGYGGNPLPLTSTPLFDAIPTYLDLIAEAYSQQGGQGGIVIFGHSLGGVTALAIAAVNEVSAKQDGPQKLPLKGVSALGSVPSALAPSEILSALASVEGDRLPINTNPTDEEKRRFLGTPEFFEETNLDKVLPALEQGEQASEDFNIPPCSRNRRPASAMRRKRLACLLIPA
jgi:pimeloyl-ACP methyl ester carboxylesterase